MPPQEWDVVRHGALRRGGLFVYFGEKGQWSVVGRQSLEPNMDMQDVQDKGLSILPIDV